MKKQPVELAKCFICLLESDDLYQCPQCKLFMCQRHKTIHKDKFGKCYPFKVEFREKLGRILVASRKIKRGELICREAPAIVGPYSRTSPQCLECFKLLPAGHKYICPGCRFPMCDSTCDNGRYHREECKILANADVSVTNLECVDVQYSAIAVLRLLLLIDREKIAVKSESNTGPSDYLLCLSEQLLDHNIERKVAQPDVWQYEEETMVMFLLEKCGFRHKWTPEQIHAAHGRILMNATALELPDGYGRGAGLYPIYSMMNTSCRNNTKSQVMDDYSVEIRAKAKINKGEEISNQYHHPDRPSFLRRPLMKEKWFFDCSCSRCLDPTEHGSYFGSILCNKKRCDGTVISCNTSDNLSSFSCQECSKLYQAEFVKSVLSDAEDSVLIIHPLDGVIEHLERSLHQLSVKLHPGNFILLEIKQKLAVLYGNIFPFTINRMSSPAKERKVQCCYEALTELEKLESGMSEWKMVLMTELAKMTKESGYYSDNPDPGGRKGMMARFMLNDGVLTLTNCLQFCN